jgi:Relaxase/Mobilisation nuclease domain
MIIKSLGRKASNKMTGGRVKNPFLNLVRYMTRTGDDEKSQSVLWHGFYGHEGMSYDEIVAAFEENARFLKERKNGNVLYHEILSFSKGYTLEDEALARAVADIGQEYLRHRAANQMAFGAIHWDTDHIHLHLMVSANAIGKTDREWLTKAQFAELQKSVEAFTLAKYPELAQTQIYGRERSREKLKTQTHEQAMKSRTGEPSRKERIKGRLHGLFEQASSMAELEKQLAAEGLEFYQRGKSRGVIERLPDGKERRHRLSTLGLDAHYDATNHRFSKQKQEKEDMEKHPYQRGNGMGAFGTHRDPNPIEVVESEFLTGQLHEAWHGKPETEKHYTDPIIARAIAAERDQQKKGREERPSPSQSKEKGDDRER